MSIYIPFPPASTNSFSFQLIVIARDRARRVALAQDEQETIRLAAGNDDSASALALGLTCILESITDERQDAEEGE